MDSGGKMDSCWFYTILLIFQTNYALRCCNTLFLQPRDTLFVEGSFRTYVNEQNA